MIKAPRVSAPSHHNGDGLMNLMQQTTNPKSKRYQSVRPNDNDGVFRIDDDDNDDNSTTKKSPSVETKVVTEADDMEDTDDTRHHNDHGYHRLLVQCSRMLGCCCGDGGGGNNKRQRIHWSHVREQISCLFRMGYPYFYESRQAKILVVKLIFFLLLDNGVNILYSYVNRDFWNALSAKDAEKFSVTLLYFVLTLLVMAPIDAMYSFQQNQLQLHWRAWLTTRTIHLYTTHPVFYTLEMQRCQKDVANHHDTTATTTTFTNPNDNDDNDDDEDDWSDAEPGANTATTHTTLPKNASTNVDRTRGLIDNPDQRISEDVAEFTQISISICFELASNMIRLCSFSIILFGIYPQLLYIAFLYALSATVITTVVFHPMVQLNVDHLKYEANLRYALVRFRENVEAIAFYKSANIEQQYIISQLMNVVNNQYSMNILTRLYNLFTYTYNLTRAIVPVVIVVRIFKVCEYSFNVFFTDLDLALLP